MILRISSTFLLEYKASYPRRQYHHCHRRNDLKL